MRSFVLLVLASLGLAACGNPAAEQAAVDMRRDPVRADTMLAVGFLPGTGQVDPGQLSQLREMVGAGQGAQRDEFVVVTDGSGGSLQQARAEQVMRSLSSAGARWVSTAVEPAMTMGPEQVVVVRSAYRIAERGCPNYSPAGIGNPNESAMPGFGCAEAYNFGQMLARPRDAAGGRPMGPADGTVNAGAIQRYRDGRVRSANGSGSAASGAGGQGSSGSGGSGTGATGSY